MPDCPVLVAGTFKFWWLAPLFSFVDSLNVTLGSLKPPSTIGTIGWDIDGNRSANFILENRAAGGNNAAWLTASAGTAAWAQLGEGTVFLNAADGTTLGSTAPSWALALALRVSQSSFNIQNSQFPTGTSG
jgi:hypothetical protein